jgi:hypothetical protein
MKRINMRKILILATALVLLPVYSWAQQSNYSVSQKGTVTSGDCAQWYGPNRIEDSGSPCGGGGGSGTVTSVSGGTTGLTVSNPTTTPTLGGSLNIGNISVNKANRAPNNNDDWLSGYYGDGSVDHLYLSAGATGCSGTPTMSFSAPATGGITATGYFLMSQVTPGTVAGAFLTIPGRGYSANPTVTVANTTGCSASPTVTAFYNPNGQLWNYNGNVYIAHQTDAGQATWMFVPTPSLPVDAVANPIKAATEVAGGTGYAVNDTITIANGTVLTVATESGGAVETVTVSTGGNWTCPTAATYAQVSTSGSGTGATFTVTVETAQAAYGLRLLTQCYNANNAADIVRESDSAQLTVGFINGVIDTSSMQKWCAGATCKWAKIYNQINPGADAVQATDANRPVLDFGQTVGGLPLLVGGYMTIPSGVAYNTAAESAYMLTRSDPLSGSGQGMGGYLFNAGIFPSQIYYQNFENNAFGYTTSTNFIPSRAPEIIGGTVSATNSCVFSVNDWEFPTGSTCAQSGGTTGGTLGYTTSTQMAMGMFVLWPRALSASERLAFRAATYATFGLVPQARSTLITSGDSRTAGDFDTNGVDYPTQILNKLLVPVRNYNVAKLGAQASDLVANCYAYNNSETDLGDCIAASQPHDSNSWDVVWIGYNDCQASVTPAVYGANLVTYVGYMHALNWKVALVTDPAACTGYAAEVAAAGADLVINNVYTDPVYGTNNWTSQTFFASGPHPSVFGQSFISTDIATGLNPQFH